MPKASINCFATYHLHYKKKLEITKSAYNLCLFWPLSKWLVFFGISFDYIYMSVTYHPH